MSARLLGYGHLDRAGPRVESIGNIFFDLIREQHFLRINLALNSSIAAPLRSLRWQKPDGSNVDLGRNIYVTSQRMLQANVQYRYGGELVPRTIRLRNHHEVFDWSKYSDRSQPHILHDHENKRILSIRAIPINVLAPEATHFYRLFRLTLGT